MSDEEYYDLLVNQNIRQIQKELKILEISLCFQTRLTSTLKENYIRSNTQLKTLKNHHDALERELCKLDGRHKQCEPPSTVERKRRKQKKILDAKSLATGLSEEQKKILVQALLSGKL